jgi:hypothetical protein
MREIYPQLLIWRDARDAIGQVTLSAAQIFSKSSLRERATGGIMGGEIAQA